MLFPETIFIENTTESTPTKVSDPKDAKEIAKKLIASGVCTQFNYYKNCYLPITILTSVTWNRIKWAVKYFCIINYKKCCKVTFVVSLAVERMFALGDQSPTLISDTLHWTSLHVKLLA